MPHVNPSSKPFRRKIRYWFDNTLNSGTVALIAWLGIISATIVVAAAVIVSLFNIDPQEKDIGFLESLWISLMRTLDPGNLASDNGWAFRIVMLAVTVVGLLIVSSLIGIVNAGITQTLENLRKGRSFVNEKDHILILGWSPMIFSLLNKLALGRKAGQKLVIVVLADKDKIEMEDAIRSKVPRDKKVLIIVRSGNVIDRHDIEIVNPHEARTIVVMSQEEQQEEIHDIHTIKTIMALMKSHNRKSEKYHIIAEISDRKNIEVIGLIGGDEVTTIVSDELFSKITVQTSLQSGLSEVYNELLEFNDIEIEFIEPEQVVGMTYHHALLSFRKGALIGIRKPDGTTDTNPDRQTIILSSYKLIVIVRRSHGIEFVTRPATNAALFSTMCHYAKTPQKSLIIGWNKKGVEIIRRLDMHFVRGSEITVFADTEKLDQQTADVSESLHNHELHVVKGDIRSKALLAEIMKRQFDHVILLCYSDEYEVQSADALTLIILIHLRQISETIERKFTIVSEIIDIRNRSLAESTHADDFIVSDRLISMVMAQLACNIELKQIFDELLTPGGSEIYLRPITNYIDTGTGSDFYTLVASASRYNQTAIGYRLFDEADDNTRNYGIHLAPLKDKVVKFSEKDKLILIADL